MNSLATKTPQYAYAVCPWIRNGNVVVERAEVEKEMAKTVMLKKSLSGYGYRQRLDRDEVCWTFEAAVESFRKTKQREIDVLAQKIKQYQELLAKTPVPDYAEES